MVVELILHYFEMEIDVPHMKLHCLNPTKTHESINLSFQAQNENDLFPIFDLATSESSIMITTKQGNDPHPDP